ncbi:uncharacterized protein [Anoplolepis gracilipes]|uniref:uncharacterized protein n=1 Tax=Anoplolepis gracilipes TaxID=354296 RepID=UPI003BA19748
MESRTRILIFYLLYIVCASEVLAEEVESRARSPGTGDVEDLTLRLDTPIQETDGTDRQSAYYLRDKRALGLLLSGLAQIFGYTVTPVQIGSLPNPTSIATSNAPRMTGNVVGQQVASTQPTSANATAPRQQETLRFTGVVNFGNNSDIVGHLQRYEQIFHGRQNNATNVISQPVLMPMPPATVSLDPKANSVTRPPLLAPFFVKIPLPIAPDLPPATIPIENFKFSYPAPAVSILSESNESETPVQKEQETIYRNNNNTERYTVEKKNIYNGKDMIKPVNHYTHQLNIKPSSQQNDKQQRKQEERIERLQEQEEQRNCDKNTHKENEVTERNRNRGKEIADRNREHASKYELAEEKKPSHDDDEDEDEDSDERYEEHSSQANKSSKQPPGEHESEETEDDESDEQFRGYKQPGNLDKYIEVGYNQQLPIGDYFHEGNPEVIRDSYGEILDNKKLEDDRIAGYISMFKHHPYVYDSQGVREPNDASGEDEREPSDGYDEHLIRLQKLREEYALPKSKYEEYDLNDEDEAKRDDRNNERIQNRTLTNPKIRPIYKEDNRPKIPTTGLTKNILRDDSVTKFENAKSQEETDFARHIPLIVPIRYLDTNDKVQQATTRQLSYEESNKLASGRLSKDNVDLTLRTSAKEKLTPQIGLPERPRQLHEGEQKELQVWPPPFDYAFDNTAPANTIISPNYPSPNYPPNYYQHVKSIAANDANSDSSSEQPSGYLVVVGNPAHPYRYPYNVYYFPNENINPQNQDSHPNSHGTYLRDQVYVPQQNTNQQFIRKNSNLTEYNLNKTTRAPYHQPHEASTNALNRYRYIFGEHIPDTSKEQSVNIDIRDHLSNINNWSSKIYQSQAKQSPPIFAQLQNVASSNQNVQSRPSNSRYSQPVVRQRRPQAGQPRRPGLVFQAEDQRKDDAKMKILRPIPTGRPFDDPQSAHDFFGFNRDDYSFAGESSDALKVAEENGKIVKDPDAPLDPVVYHYDKESVVKHADEPENDTEKAKVTEYRNKVATLKISEQRQLKPNGPIRYVDFIRNI